MKPDDGRPEWSLALLHAESPGWTVATAEACTAGGIAQRIVSVPGSSAWFRGGVAAYANDLKTGLLGVPAEVLARHGAVSPEVTLAMAEGARQLLGATHAVAVSGVAGPTGGTPTKPVGLVHLAVAGPGAPALRRLHLPGDRAGIMAATGTEALRLLLSVLTRDHPPAPGNETPGSET